MDGATLYMVVAIRGEPHSTPNRVFETVQICHDWVAAFRRQMPAEYELVSYECRRWDALRLVR